LTGPKPAGNGQKPPSSKNALTLDPPAEEERAPWEELAAADSDKALASLDTNPTPARKSAVTSAVQPRVTSLFANRDRRFWIIFAGTVAAVFILLGILLLAWALSSGAPTEQPSTRRPPLVVNPAGGLSLSKALEQAHSGDRIVVESDIVDALPPITFKDLTIEAAPGKMIHWKFPPNPPAGAKKLLSLHDAEGFRLKGFRLDGDNRAELLVQISGRCPGLVLENLSLTKFQKRGIVVFNCEGTADRRMTFANLHFITKEGQTALFFNINDRLLDRPRTNSFLTIRDCDFDGPGAAVKAPNLDFIGKTVQLPAGVAPIKGE
jgi:hypothetical protein